jgi:hypothetical protein
MLRRGFLATLAAGLAACSGAAPPAPAARPEDALPPLRTGDLLGLLSLPRLRWVLVTRPREIAAIPWLIPPIATVVPEDNLNRFTAQVGFDLRQIPEAAIASYADEGGEATFYLVRHNADPTAIERAFRARLVANQHRTVERPDVIRVSGKIGTTSSAMVVLGRDVVGYQQGGSPTRGPARIATLYATDKLKKTPTVLAEEPLKALSARLGAAPLRALSLGPFEGELARGARGLLAGATAIGGSARPSAREGLLLAIAVMGDFSKSGEAASRELVNAWNDLANGSFGRLLGLDQPIERPLATHANDAVAVAVELRPDKLAKGLRAATSARIDEIMR